MKKLYILIVTLILSTNAISQTEAVGSGGIDGNKPYQMCFKVGSTGSDNKVGSTGSDNKVGSTGSDNKIGSDGTGDKLVCKIIPLKK